MRPMWRPFPSAQWRPSRCSSWCTCWWCTASPGFPSPASSSRCPSLPSSPSAPTSCPRSAPDPRPAQKSHHFQVEVVDTLGAGPSFVRIHRNKVEVKGRQCSQIPAHLSVQLRALLQSGGLFPARSMPERGTTQALCDPALPAPDIHLRRGLLTGPSWP